MKGRQRLGVQTHGKAFCLEITMNIFKKIGVSFTALALIMSIGIGVFASSYEIKELEITINPPEGTYIFTSLTPDDDESWKAAGIKDPIAHKTNYEQLGTLAHFSANGGKTNVYVGKKESDKTKAYFSLKSMSKESLAEFLSSYNTPEEQGMASNAEIIEHPQTPIIKMNITSKSITGDTTQTIYELVYFTIINGYTVSFSHHDTAQIDTASQDYMKELINSVNFLNIKEPIQNDPQAMAQAFLTLGLFVAFIAVVIAVFVVAKVKNKQRKNATKILADKLSVYRKERSTTNISERASLYENSTEHTDAAIKTFSTYQVYVRNPFGALASIAVSVFGTILGILTSAEWWMILLIAAAACFCIFKFITAGAATEKSLKKVYGKLKSKTAKYSFFEEEFLISGIQSAEFYPYFQITDVKEYKGFYYIFFGENNTYFIDKKSFTKGSAENFKEFIKGKTCEK